MALVNPNIAMSYRGVELPQQNMLADYAAIQQIQGGQRQAEAAQMQMQRMRQTDAALEQVRQVAMKNGGPGDLNEIANAYLQAPDREMQQFGIGLIQKLKERAEFNEFGKKNYPDLFGGAPAAAPPSEAYPGYNADIGMTNALAPAPAAAPPVNAMAAPASEPYPGYNQAIGMTPSVNAMAAPVRAQQLSPTGKTRQQLEGMIFMAQGNPLYKGMAETAKLELAEMMRTPVYHNVPGVGLVNPNTKEVLVPSKAAPAAPPTPLNVTRLIQERDALPKGHPNIAIYNAAIRKETEFAPRAAEGGAAPKPMTQAQKVKYTKDKVSDKDVVTGAFAVTGELEKLTDELVGNPDKKIAPAPGLSSITGFSALTNPLALPSGDARKALQKLETFKGKIMALGRQLASQEGKLGNMAVQEWKFVSDAVQKIDPAAGNLDAQMRDVVRQAREYSQRQQAKYDDTYADDLATQGGGTAPAAVGANVVVTPDGRSHTFPTPAAAAAFKKAAGL